MGEGSPFIDVVKQRDLSERKSKLRSALSAFPSEERRQQVDEVLAELAKEERRRKLERAISDLSDDQLEKIAGHLA
jgi:hypothetical protein